MNKKPLLPAAVITLHLYDLNHLEQKTLYHHLDTLLRSYKMLALLQYESMAIHALQELLPYIPDHQSIALQK